MRVLLIPELYPTNENPVAGIFINDQIKALLNFSEVVVYNTNPFYKGMYKQLKGVEYYDFHLLSKKPSKLLKPIFYRYWENKALDLALKIPNIDLVHLHGSSLRGLMALKFARKRKIPLVVTEHTGPWSAIASRYSVFERAKKVLKLADVVMPVSHHLKNEMIDSRVEMNRIEVLGNPVDGDLYTLRSQNLNTPKRILFVGRLDEFKGAMRTLKAFHAISEIHPGWTLSILGSGAESESIKEFIANNGLDHRVEFIEKAFDRVELANYYHSSSFLVFPSRFESFGLVAAEAMATGLPVLCTNQTGPLDYSLPQNAIPIDPNSVDAIASGMNSMIEKLDEFDPVKVRKSIIEQFGLDTYAGKLESIYRSI